MKDATDFILMGAREIYPIIIKSGLVNEKFANNIVSKLKEAKFNNASYYIFPKQAQVFGSKL